MPSRNSRRHQGQGYRNPRRRARTTDIVDANVIEGALQCGNLIISSGEGGLAAIAAALSRHIDIDYP